MCFICFLIQFFGSNNWIKELFFGQNNCTTSVFAACLGAGARRRCFVVLTRLESSCKRSVVFIYCFYVVDVKIHRAEFGSFPFVNAYMNVAEPCLAVDNAVVVER